MTLKTKTANFKTPKCATCDKFFAGLCSLYPNLTKYPEVEPDYYCDRHSDIDYSASDYH